MTKRRLLDWQPVIEQLLDGKQLFIAKEDLSPGSLKYLRLALSGRLEAKGGERHRVNAIAVNREGIAGYVVFAEPMKKVRHVVQATVLG